MSTKTHRRTLRLITSLAVAATTMLASSEALAYRNWNNWYPLDRNQAPGQRAVNSWGDPDLPGQSTCKYSTTPTGLPANYGNESVQYFLNWWDTSPTIDGYSEVLSIRGSNYTLLDLWAAGTSSDWKVFYDPFSMTHVPIAEFCTVDAIATMSSRAQAGPKEPMIWRLPNNPGQVYQSNLVCAAVFGDENHPYDYDVVSRTAWEWVEVETVDVNTQVISATNYYYTSNTNHCLPGYEYMDKTRSLAIPGTYDGIVVDGCVWAVEDYSMQKRLLSPLNGGLFDWSIDNIWQDPPRTATDGDGVVFTIENSFC